VDFICFTVFSHLDSNMLLCYSAIPSRSLRSAYQLMISGGDVKAVQGATLVQAAPVEAEPTISVSALLAEGRRPCRKSTAPLGFADLNCKKQHELQSNSQTYSI